MDKSMDAFGLHVIAGVDAHNLWSRNTERNLVKLEISFSFSLLYLGQIFWRMIRGSVLIHISFVLK